MDLAGGAMVAEDANDSLLAACKRSNELTLEATLATASLDQKGPA